MYLHNQLPPSSLSVNESLSQGKYICMWFPIVIFNCDYDNVVIKCSNRHPSVELIVKNAKFLHLRRLFSYLFIFTCHSVSAYIYIYIYEEPIAD